MYICQLPSEKQNEIKKVLASKGICGADLERAMESKVADIDYLLSDEYERK